MHDNSGAVGFHDFLNDQIRERGWNLSRFAEACGDVSPSLAAKWLTDNPRKRVVPGPVSCQKIARALGLDPDYVLSLAGHRDALDLANVEDDPIMREILAAIPEMREAVKDIPREMWITVLRATMRRATNEVRDTSNVISLASERKVRRPVVSTPAGPVVSRPKRAASRASQAPDAEIEAYQQAVAA